MESRAEQTDERAPAEPRRAEAQLTSAQVIGFRSDLLLPTSNRLSETIKRRLELAL